MSEYIVHKKVYVIRSPNIAHTEYYTTYSKVLDRLKDYEDLTPAEGVGTITIEYQRDMTLHKDFDEDTQSIKEE